MSIVGDWLFGPKRSLLTMTRLRSYSITASTVFSIMQIMDDLDAQLDPVGPTTGSPLEAAIYNDATRALIPRGQLTEKRPDELSDIRVVHGPRGWSVQFPRKAPVMVHGHVGDVAYDMIIPLIERHGRARLRPGRLAALLLWLPAIVTAVGLALTRPSAEILLLGIAVTATAAMVAVLGMVAVAKATSDRWKDSYVRPLTWQQIWARRATAVTAIVAAVLGAVIGAVATLLATVD